MTCRIISFVVLLCALRLSASEVKPILTVVPSLSELGPTWTTNVIAYLLDPRSHPSEIDYRHDIKTSPMLALQRANMEKDGRNAFAIVLYGRGDMTVNQGWHRVYIYRWENRRALHNRWVDWKMNPARIVRSISTPGDDYYWTDDGFMQDFTFRRGLFHVSIEAGSLSDYRPIVRLAEVIDAKMRGKTVSKVDAGDRRGGAVEVREVRDTAAKTKMIPASVSFLEYATEADSRVARFELTNHGDVWSHYSGPYVEVWDGANWAEHSFDAAQMAVLGRSKLFRPTQIVAVPAASLQTRWRAWISVQGRSSGNYRAESAAINP